jgi:hypothetical protein
MAKAANTPNTPSACEPAEIMDLVIARAVAAHMRGESITSISRKNGWSPMYAAETIECNYPRILRACLPLWPLYGIAAPKHLGVVALDEMYGKTGRAR